MYVCSGWMFLDHMSSSFFSDSDGLLHSDVTLLKLSSSSFTLCTSAEARYARKSRTASCTANTATQSPTMEINNAQTTVGAMMRSVPRVPLMRPRTTVRYPTVLCHASQHALLFVFWHPSFSLWGRLRTGHKLTLANTPYRWDYSETGVQI